MPAAKAISVSRQNDLSSCFGTEAVVQWMPLLTRISRNCTSFSFPLLWLNLWLPILDSTRVQHENSAKNNVLVQLAAGSTEWSELYNCVQPINPAPILYTLSNKNPSAWNFLHPKPEVTCGTVAIIIPVVLFSPHLRIRGVSLSSIHYNHSHHVYSILTEDNNTFA